jgi:PAT family beta-lactamase induction signal transducer AmpG
MENSASKSKSPWAWVPTLYFGQGIPYVAVMTLAVFMYKNLEVSNTDIALYTSWLYLPWVIKPLWSPVVDLFRTKRFWIVALQFVVGAALALVALTIPGPMFFKMTLAIFWLLAFSSATHDIAADGFYLLSLKEHEQSAFVGVRSTFYRLAMIGGQGGLVYLAGTWQEKTGSYVEAWTLVFWLLAAFFGVIAAYHFFVLPKPANDVTAPRRENFFADYFAVFATFFKKPHILRILGFLLLYRLAESQLLKLAAPFLLDDATKGGLGLSTKQAGLFYGTVGPVALTLGGLLGGYLISKHGLKRMLWPMVAAINVPNAIFVLLAWKQPSELSIVGAAVAVEQFGYGFGFTAYMIYMMMVARGEHQTAHYALCTGFMALGMMLPGMPAGWIQTQLGYTNFFVWVCIATIPSFAAAAWIKVDPAFGKKAMS